MSIVNSVAQNGSQFSMQVINYTDFDVELVKFTQENDAGEVLLSTTDPDLLGGDAPRAIGIDVDNPDSRRFWATTPIYDKFLLPQPRDQERGKENVRMESTAAESTRN